MLSKLWNSSRPGDARRAFDCELLKRFREDTHGGVLVYVAIMLPILLGVSGLAVDASLWYAQKRSTQAIADTAAYATILEIERTGDETLAETAAKYDAVLNGLDESAGDKITFNSPPKSGAFAGTAGYYEVIVERPAPVFLARLVMPDDFNVAARAVSGGGNASTPPCLLSLDPSAMSAMKVNSGTVRADGCDVQVNSSTSTALNVPNQGSLEADTINIVGDYTGNGDMSSTPNIDMPAVSDPLSSLAAPAFSGCDYNNVTFNNGIHPLSPGVYCGGIKVTGSAQVTMQPGSYVITNGQGQNAALSTSGNSSSLSGDGVSIYFDGNADLSIAGDGAVNLSAPTSGTYTGVLFYGDRNAPTNVFHQITGGGSVLFDGVMYFPASELKYNGNGAGSADTSISAIMARELTFGGNGTLDFHYADDAVLPPAMEKKLTLVE